MSYRSFENTFTAMRRKLKSHIKEILIILIFFASSIILYKKVFDTKNQNKLTEHNQLIINPNDKKFPIILKAIFNNNSVNVNSSLPAETTTQSPFIINRNLNIFDLSQKVNLSNSSCSLNTSILSQDPQKIEVDEKVYCFQDIEEKLLNYSIKPGGISRPTDCEALFKVAIVIPYRSRRSMLPIFMNHMHPFLAKQNIDYGIYLVEPLQGLTFNRGLLLNIGFLESLKLSRDHWDCFIFHDIDLLPEDERNIYSCPPELKPRHMSALVSTMQYKYVFLLILLSVSNLRLK